MHLNFSWYNKVLVISVNKAWFSVLMIGKYFLLSKYVRALPILLIFLKKLFLGIIYQICFCFLIIFTFVLLSVHFYLPLRFLFFFFDIFSSLFSFSDFKNKYLRLWDFFWSCPHCISFKNLFILYCSIADWQCCDSFTWTVKGLSHPYTAYPFSPSYQFWFADFATFIYLMFYRCTVFLFFHFF